MSEINYTPKSKDEMYKLARAFANKTNQVVIFYRDYDFDFEVWSYCTEKIWDNMVENGEVEKNWFYAMITY